MQSKKDSQIVVSFSLYLDVVNTSSNACIFQCLSWTAVWHRGNVLAACGFKYKLGLISFVWIKVHDSVTI